MLLEQPGEDAAGKNTAFRLTARAVVGLIGGIKNSLDCSSTFLVVVADYNVVGIPAFEYKANSPLVVDGNRMLRFTVTFRGRVQCIPGLFISLTLASSDGGLEIAFQDRYNQVTLRSLKRSATIVLLVRVAISISAH